MTAKTVACTIERRLLVNYRIEPEFVARLLPRPFRPQLVSGLAVGGVCFIRLGGLRAGHLPRVPRLVSENAAHRFAVEWDDANGTQAGVYVPRRDTNSRITAAAGGKVFPGSYRLARFEVDEPGGQVGRAGHRGHADRRGHREQPRGGHPLGPDPHPRTPRLRAAAGAHPRH